jgi:hypothetical protein
VRARAMADRSATPGNQRSLQATSAGLAIPAAVSFASFAQLILVEAGLPQFAAHIPPSWPLAGLSVSAAISFAPLSQRVLVFTGTPQFLALPSSYSDASRSDLDRLGEGRNRKYEESRCRCGAERIFAHCFQHSLILQLLCAGE